MELILPCADVASDIVVAFTSVFFDVWLLGAMVAFLVIPMAGFVYWLRVHESVRPGVAGSRDAGVFAFRSLTLTPILFADAFTLIPWHSANIPVTATYEATQWEPVWKSRGLHPAASPRGTAFLHR